MFQQRNLRSKKNDVWHHSRTAQSSPTQSQDDEVVEGKKSTNWLNTYWGQSRRHWTRHRSAEPSPDHSPGKWENNVLLMEQVQNPRAKNTTKEQEQGWLVNTRISYWALACLNRELDRLCRPNYPCKHNSAVCDWHHDNATFLLIRARKWR